MEEKNLELLNENNKLLKQQVKFAKVRTALLLVMTIVVCVVGIFTVTRMDELVAMSDSMQTIADKLEEVDMEQLNASIAEFSQKVETLDMDSLNSTIENLNTISQDITDAASALDSFSSSMKGLFTK